MRIGKIIKWLLILLLIIIIGGIAFLFTIDLNNYKPTIQNQARNALGRDVTIEGDIGFAWSLVPSLSVDGVRVANAEGLEPADMVSVGHAEAQVEIVPLVFDREIRITKLVLQDADIYLQADDQGGGNWVMGEPGEGEPATPESGSGGSGSIPFLGDVLLEDVNVTYVDPAGETYRVSLAEATMQAESLTSDVEISATGTVQDEELSLQGTVGSIQQLLEQQPDWPFELALELAGAEASLAGTVADTEAFRALTAGLSLSMEEPARLAALGGVDDVQELPPVTLTADMNLDGDIIAISDIMGGVGDAELDGNLTVRLGGAVPAIQGALAIGVLDLDALLPEAEGEGGGSDAASGPGDGRMIPDVELPLEGLNAANADLALTIEQLAVSGMVLDDIAADVTLNNGVLTAVLDRATLFDGAINATVNANAGQQALGIDATYDGFSMGSLLASQGLGDRVSGLGTVALDFAGAAPDLRGLLASGNGALSVDVIGGELNTREMSTVTRSLLRLLLPNIDSHGVIALNCAVVNYDIADGIARSNGILVDTPLFAAVAEGALDLSAETLAMLVRAQTGDVAGLSLSAPVRIAGPWSSPTPTLDAQAVVGGLTQGLLPGIEPTGLRVPNVDPPADGVNQCAAALANPTYPAAPSAGEQVDRLREAIEDPGGALEGAGRQLLEGVVPGGGGDGEGEGESDGEPADAVGDAINKGLRNLLGN